MRGGASGGPLSCRAHGAATPHRGPAAAPAGRPGYPLSRHSPTRVWDACLQGNRILPRSRMAEEPTSPSALTGRSLSANGEGQQGPPGHSRKNGLPGKHRDYWGGKDVVSPVPDKRGDGAPSRLRRGGSVLECGRPAPASLRPCATPPPWRKVALCRLRLAATHPKPHLRTCKEGIPCTPSTVSACILLRQIPRRRAALRTTP